MDGYSNDVWGLNTERGANMSNEDVTATLNSLRSAHQEADARLVELERHLALSPEEQVEVVRLKKRKLQLKDEIRALSVKTKNV